MRIIACENWINTTVYGLEHRDKILYIGKTALSLKTRIARHFRSALRVDRKAGCPKLYAYIREYPNHEEYTLHVFGTYTPEEAAKREIELIVSYNTRMEGMNVSTGGNMSSGPDHYMFGKSACKEAVKASVAARKGRALSEEHKAKQRAAHALKKHSYKHLAPIVCDQTGETWVSLTDTAKHFGVTITTIYNRMKRKDWTNSRNKQLGELTFSYKLP